MTSEGSFVSGKDPRSTGQVLRDLVDLLEVNPPKISKEDGPAESSTESDNYEYKETFEESNNTKLNELDIVPILVSSASEGFLCSTPHLRICSIGCGNGTKDALFLKTLLLKFPNATIEYVGLDILEANCVDTRLKLSQLPEKRLEIHVLCRDFEADDISDLQKFDIVNCCHMIYYVTDVGRVVDKIMRLVKIGGKAVVTADSIEGLSEMRKLLWRHEGRHDFWTSRDIMQVLDRRSMKYSVKRFVLVQDVSKQVENGFKSPASRIVLDFACQTKMKWYCKEAVELCVEYVTAFARTEHDGHVMHHPEDIIAVEGVKD